MLGRVRVPRLELSAAYGASRCGAAGSARGEGSGAAVSTSATTSGVGSAVCSKRSLQHERGLGVALALDHQVHAIRVGFAQVGDALDPAGDQVRDLLDKRRLVALVGQLRAHDGHGGRRGLLERALGLHHTRPRRARRGRGSRRCAPSARSRRGAVVEAKDGALVGSSCSARSCRSSSAVRSGFSISAACSATHFSQVVRRDVGGHAHRDAVEPLISSRLAALARMRAACACRRSSR